MVTDPRVAKVSLTGSVPTGRKVYAAAADGIRHVTMELGGKSPMIVFEDADIENAVSGAILGNFYSSGQVCSNGTRVFVHESVKDEFLKRLVARTKAMKIGDPLDPRRFSAMPRDEAMLALGGELAKVHAQAEALRRK